MKRVSRRLLALACITALLSFGACGKKPEANAPAAASPAAPQVAPTEPPAPGAVEAACVAVEERAAKVREAFAKRVAEVPSEAMGPVGLDVRELNAYGACVKEGSLEKGTWAIELVDATIDPDSVKEDAEGGAAASVEVRLVWIAPDGATRSTTTSMSFGFSSSSMHVHGVHDFDRDGRPELVIAVTAGSPDHRGIHLQFFRAGDTSVERFWKDVEPAVTDLEDIDGDGVLDLLHGDEFLAEQGMNKLSGFPGVTRVASLEKLERADEAVKGYYLKRCPNPVKADEVAGFDSEEIETLIAMATCAWLWGETNGAIEAAVSKAVQQPQLGDGMAVKGPWSKADAKPAVSLR